MGHTGQCLVSQAISAYKIQQSIERGFLLDRIMHKEGKIVVILEKGFYPGGKLR
jgi:hypothetical protein